MSTSIVAETTRSRPSATAAAWLGLLLVLLVFLYHETMRSMVLQWWNEEDYNHGFVVPIFAAYLVWQQWDRLRSLAVRSDPRGLALLGLGLLVFVVGSVGAELFLQRASIVVVITALVMLFLGPAWVRALSFPLGFLVFAIPIPAVIRNVIALPLQLFAAKTATICLSGAGIPVFREGNVIVLAQTTLEVADACSGIRSLQALLALAVVFAYVSQTRFWKRALLVIAAVPIAIAANAFRVTGTGLLAHYFGLKAAEGFYHSLAGYLMFGVAFVGLLLCGTLLNRLAPDAAPPPEASSSAPAEALEGRS